MNSVGYNFNAGTHVWIVDNDDNSVVPCVITHIILEIKGDPVDEDIIYRLNPVDTPSSTILTRDESEVFATSEDAINFLSDDTLTSPSLSTHVINYEYSIGESVWIFDEDVPLNRITSEVKININYSNSSTITYKLPPVDVNYSSLYRSESDIFTTEEVAKTHIKNVISSRYS